ncbi:tetratricopeptide repeat protein [Streptomyces sp. NPDC089919]|uniref:serine/threonine-protein kinase n=1 Tax=Streptomyces sp. NPDC089919 TaxID=3155188 RepID=UPI0034209935
MAEKRLIQGRYRPIDLIGRGGMGEVWRARDESLGRHVAVKCLKPLGPDRDPHFTQVLRERFRREARVAASLQHRGVTVVHDFGDESASGGLLYLVMELLDGRNLSQVMEESKGRPLPVDEVLDIAEQVAAALAYTHEQGIVHRDLKPANIMRLSDGTVKICDFGIARLAHDIGFTAKLNGGGVAMGTPHYMSPEQIADSEVDHRSDLYSLGCVLYEIATGAPPFDLGDSWSVLVGHRDTAPVPPREHRPELPGHFERIVLDLLAKCPEERPGDARLLHRRLVEGRGAGTAHGAPVAHRPAAGTAEPAGPPLPHWARQMYAGPKAALPPVDPQGAAAAGVRALDALTAFWTRGTTPPAGPGQAGDPLPTAPADPRVTARLRSLRPERPGTLAARYEHAHALARGGRPADALTEYAAVAGARRDALGAEHPDTLAARQEMAFVLGRLDRHAEAHALYTEVLALRDRVMGADHPDTLRCRHNLALTLARLGRAEDSYLLLDAVAGARTRVLGADHPDTLTSRYEAAYALGQLERWTQALAGYREVARARERTLGRDHPDTLATRYEIGISLGRLGHSQEALEHYRALAADRTRGYGARDPETLRARHGLGVNLGRLGRWEAALEEARQVAALRATVLGPDHPDTQLSRREAAVALGRLGRWAEALTGYEEVAAARERALGPTHPETLAALADRAYCLGHAGRPAEATALHQRIAALRGAVPAHGGAAPAGA